MQKKEFFLASIYDNESSTFAMETNIKNRIFQELPGRRDVSGLYCGLLKATKAEDSARVDRNRRC